MLISNDPLYTINFALPTFVGIVPCEMCPVCPRTPNCCFFGGGNSLSKTGSKIPDIELPVEARSPVL